MLLLCGSVHKEAKPILYLGEGEVHSAGIGVGTALIGGGGGGGAKIILFIEFHPIWYHLSPCTVKIDE